MAETSGRDDELLFHMVLIIDLQHIDGKPEPFVSYRLPKLWTKDPFSAAVAPFCFPDMDDFPKEEMQNESFSFVLTESDGDRRFGYCLRRLQQGNGKRMPVAYVVLSYLPCFSLYTRILERVAYHYENSSGVILTQFLESVIQNPFPAPGETCHVRITDTAASNRGSGSRVGSRIGSQEQEKLTWKFTRPDSDSEFENVDIAAMVLTLDAPNIIRAFVSLLVERRVIFCAKKITTLSAVVQAIMALLYPLSWQHIFIPILPASLLSYCCAPMPFVVGVLASSIDEVLKLPMDAVTIIMLDENKFLQVSSEEMEDDLDLMPARFIAPLTKQLKLTAKAAKKCSKKSMVTKRLGEVAQAITARKVQELVLQKILLDFYSELLKPIYLLHHLQGGSRPNLSDAVTLAPPDLRPLMKLLVTSQLMEMFAQKHIIVKEPGHNDAFQKKMQAWLRKEHPTPEQQEEDKNPKSRAVSNAQVKELMDKARAQAAPKRSSVIVSSPVRRRTMATDPHLMPPPLLPAREPRSRSATHRVIDMANKPLPSAPDSRPGHKRQLSHSQTRTLPNKPSSHNRQLSASAFPTLTPSPARGRPDQHPPQPDTLASPPIIEETPGHQSMSALPRQASMPVPAAASSDSHLSMGSLPLPGQQQRPGRGPPPRPPPKKAPSAPSVTATPLESEAKAPEERAPPVPPPKARPAAAVPPQRPQPPSKAPGPAQVPAVMLSPRPGEEQRPHLPSKQPLPRAGASPHSVSAPPARPQPPAGRPNPPVKQVAAGPLSPRDAAIAPVASQAAKESARPQPPQRPKPPSVLPPGATPVFPSAVMPVPRVAAPPAELEEAPHSPLHQQHRFDEVPQKALPPDPISDEEDEADEVALPEVPVVPSAAELASIYSESLAFNLERDRRLGTLDSATLDESMEKLIDACGRGIVLLEEEYDSPLLYWEAVEASMWNGSDEPSCAADQVGSIATEMGCLDAGLLYLLDFVEKKIPEGEASFSTFASSASSALAKCKEKVFSGSSGKTEVAYIRSLFRDRHKSAGQPGAAVSDEQLEARLDAIAERARAAKKAQLKIVQEQRKQLDDLEACSSLERQVHALGGLRISTRRSQRLLKKILSGLTASWAEVEVEIRQVVMEEQTLYFESIATLVLTKYLLYCKAVASGALARLESQLISARDEQLLRYRPLLERILSPSFCTSMHVFMTSLGCEEDFWLCQEDLRRHAALVGRCYTHNSIDELQVIAGLLAHAAGLRFASQIRLLDVASVGELARVMAELITFFLLQNPLSSPMSSGGDMKAGHVQAVQLVLNTLHGTPPSLEFDTVLDLLRAQSKVTLCHPEDGMLSCTIPSADVVLSPVIKVGDGFTDCQLFIPFDTSYVAQCLAINTSFLTVNGFPDEGTLIKQSEKGWWGKEAIIGMGELLKRFRHLQVTADDGDDSCGSDEE